MCTMDKTGHNQVHNGCKNHTHRKKLWTASVVELFGIICEF
jgi:hypothetical protein